MNTKVEDNFVAHNMDIKFELFGVRTWEIWCRQGRATDQENLDEADLWKPSLLLSQRGSRARQGGAHPKAPQGHKYKPLGAQGGGWNRSIHYNSAKPISKH
jgi:hypothetical protein